MASKKYWKREVKRCERLLGEMNAVNDERNRDLIAAKDTEADLQQRITSVYRERDRLVAALSTIFPSHLATDNGEEPGYRNVICVHLPVGQATWHISDDELKFFTHVAFLAKDVDCVYDGHTTQAKYERLAVIQPALWKPEDFKAHDKAHT